MESFKNQIVPLLKKNLILKGKSKIKFILEILSPLVVIGILFGVLYLTNIINRDYSLQYASGFTSLVRKTNQLLIGAPGGLNEYQKEILESLKKQVAMVNTGISRELIDQYFVEFSDMDSMDAYYHDPENYRGVMGGLWFPEQDFNEFGLPRSTIQYSIKVDSDYVNDNKKQFKERDDSQIYLRHYFTQIQTAVDQSLFMMHNISVPLLVKARRFPNPYQLFWQQWTDGRKIVLLNTGGIFLTASIFAGLYTTITNIVVEKETKIFESMKMMGLNSLAYYVSISIISLSTQLIPSTLLTVIILKATGLIHTVNWFVLAVLLVFYAITLLLLAFILCKFFKKSKFAGLVSFFIVIVLCCLGIAINPQEFSPYIKMAFCIISPIAISIANYTWTTKDLVLLKAVDPHWEFSVPEYQIIGILVFDMFLYILVLWYLENVFTGEYGISKPWYFFFSIKYWKKQKTDQSIFDEELNSNLITNYGDGVDKNNFEVFPNDLKSRATISIRNLRKEFKTGDGLRVAVNDLSIDIYKNQIHAFLGPNGSGKSTTIGMLTGLIESTSGGARINGYDINSDMNKIRKNLGVCPQSDIIWDSLTVLEHLEFYAALKGYKNKNQRKIEASKLAIEVGLKDHLNAPAGTLSGGQKRKLCLAISFIGPNCDIIFLDEVTSGLDPSSRRCIWDFILKYKTDKTIILTTHYLEEADILSDCISIISFGQLKCCGSSLFLKNRFGVGYLLTLSKDSNKIIENVGSSSKQSSCSTSNISNFIFNHIPEARLLSDAGTELSYRLPTSSLPKFSAFFKDLDQNKHQLNIENYGISITTMEEVFLNIISDSNTVKPNFDQQAINKALKTQSRGIRGRQQFKGLLVKRIKTTKKDIKSFILSIVIPLLVLIAALVLYKNMRTISVYNTETEPLLLDINVYGDNSITPYSINNVQNQTGFEEIIKESIGNSRRVKFIPYEDLDDYLVHNFEGTSPGALYFDSPEVNGMRTFEYIVYYNKDWLHALPIYINFVDSEILKSKTGITIQTTSLPFVHIKTAFEKASVDINFVAIIFFIILSISSFTLIAASHAGNISQERQTRVKRLLYISGLKKYIYWLSNLTWDYIQTSVLVLLFTVVIIAVDDKFQKNFFLYFIGIVLFNGAMIPLGYLMSYKFSSGKAVGAIFGILFGSGLLMTVTCFILRIWAIKESSFVFQDITDIIDIVFYAISPVFCFSKILTIITNFPGITRVGESYIKDYWGLHFGLLPVAFLLFHCILWITWIMVQDYCPEIRGVINAMKSNKKKSPKPEDDEDSDVTRERQLVESILNRASSTNSDEIKENYPIFVKDLHKEYPAIGKHKSKVAVFNTTLAIPKGEAFALLGLNGAGKSTTISLIAGETIPTSGQIKVNGFDLLGQRKNALNSIGYCFQFDALIGLLNAREQLTLYCRIKGVDEDEIHDTVEAFIQIMDLGGISNSNVCGYSGGNRRKVSLSIACIGNPSVVLLDEISCGVDACVKRYMWNVITELKKNKVIILTTHSIPECQAVCDRLTIMKDGKLKALGSNQHIKDKFGSGYSIEVKFKKEFIDDGVELFKKSFPTSKLIDHQHGLAASFEMPNPPSAPIDLSSIFSTIEKSLKPILEDYSVSQTSIEQIFIKLTSNANSNGSSSSSSSNSGNNDDHIDIDN